MFGSETANIHLTFQVGLRHTWKNGDAYEASETELDEWSTLSKNEQLYLKYKDSRPAYAKGQVEKVWEQSINEETGKVVDPNKPPKELFWDKTKSRYDQWHMGHKTDFEYSGLLEQLRRGEIDEAKFLEEYRNPANYQAEDPVRNMSHQHEASKTKIKPEPKK